MMAAIGSGNGCRKSMKVLSLSCLNHISRKCSNLSESENFYENLLGFEMIKRPGSFDFKGAWLFNYGIGIHLLQSESGNAAQEREIDPKSDHISFQCEDIDMVETKLKENDIKYIRRVVEEGGILVDQLFFHDPDGFMIEVCNCDQLPVVPLVRSPSTEMHNNEEQAAKNERTPSVKDEQGKKQNISGGKRQKMSKVMLEDDRIVIGTDFGTTLSKFARSLMKDPDELCTFYDLPFQGATGAKEYYKTKTSLWHTETFAPRLGLASVCESQKRYSSHTCQNQRQYNGIQLCKPTEPFIHFWSFLDKF